MILIIDSEKKSEAKTRQIFDEAGFGEVIIVKTAAQARENLNIESYQFSLIIINGELDDSNGFELCREIKKTNAGKYAYIMMIVSSSENKTAIEKAKHSGATGFGVKPYYSAEFQRQFIRYTVSKVVLIVEDDPVIRKIVKGVMNEYHLETIEVDDGIRAHNLLNKMLPPRLVLMDIGLPNKNGIQLVELIRSKPVWRKTPVVMLTGSSDVTNVKKCLAAGANDYLTKPVNLDIFRKRLSKYLSDES
ncbi:MAG: response regulator [Gammaproteobacteria bacterium]|nr:response regulator [Gammaproteobacteria bacterium]